MAGEYKDEKLREWKKEGWDLRIGIGDKGHDAEAYLQNKMKAIMIGDEDDLPDGTIRVTDWKEIEKMMFKNP